MNSDRLTYGLAERIVAADPLGDSQAVGAARAGVLDWLASALSARGDSGADRIVSALGLGAGAAVNAGAGDATVLGRGYRLAALDAALVNGYLSHALDYDDVHESVRGHPSAVLLPALLAEAEARHATGADFLAAYIIGVETMCRLGLALGSSHYEAGWHSTATLGVIGAAAACARLMRLDTDQTVHALGLAVTRSGGLRLHFGSEVKPLHAGLAARDGLMAARLAEAGITGDQEPLEGQVGFLSIFSGGEARPERVLADWGDSWQIYAPGLWFKQYPFCSAAQHAADAALAIRDRDRPAAADIEKVIVTYPPGGDAALVIRHPKTGIEGRFSVEYVIASVLISGELGMETFSDRSIPADVQAIAAKVDRQYNSQIVPATNAMPKGRFTIVNVRMTDGTTYIERVDCPRGAPGRPLLEEERLAKYEDAIRGLPVAWAKLPKLIDELEELEDMGYFIPE
jgi:2-methylcitrate dehydratase PrpD